MREKDYQMQNREEERATTMVLMFHHTIMMSYRAILGLKIFLKNC